MNGRNDVQVFEQLSTPPAPALRPAPPDVRGFRVCLDLHTAEPPVWRRLELPAT